MTKPERDADYLGHIREAIERIDEYLIGVARERFLADRMLQDAVIRNIEIVGEAARKLSDGFTTRHPSVPWRAIAEMRNRLAHGYFAVNLLTVWNVTQSDLPKLREQLKKIIG
jgi:uncharacterized protein with HEPN domain